MMSACSLHSLLTELMTSLCSYYHIPENISTVVDLLEDAGITWATYQENMPEDHFYGE